MNVWLGLGMFRIRAKHFRRLLVLPLMAIILVILAVLMVFICVLAIAFAIADVLTGWLDRIDAWVSGEEYTADEL